MLKTRWKNCIILSLSLGKQKYTLIITTIAIHYNNTVNIFILY